MEDWNCEQLYYEIGTLRWNDEEEGWGGVCVCERERERGGMKGW